jgi:excisionase family DNA binding protein
MLKTPPLTEAAFLALLNALDAEIKELQAAGQQRFHADGIPQSARLLSHAAIQRAKLRDEVAQLHVKWNADIPPPPPAPSAEPRGSLETKPRPVAHAMSHNEAARRLGVSPEKIRTWLESGLIKGQQLTRTKWQLDAQDVLDFARKNPDRL